LRTYNAMPNTTNTPKQHTATPPSTPPSTSQQHPHDNITIALPVALRVSIHIAQARTSLDFMKTRQANKKLGSSKGLGSCV
jgi:hypothetical protein